MTLGRYWRIPLAPEGLPFVLPPTGFSVICAVAGWWGAALMGALVTVCIAAFFRDPERQVPLAPEAIVSPADGRIKEVVEEAGRWRISIFLSVLDVHINRVPYGGTVTDITYTPGQFRPAYDREASQVNEANRLTLEHQRYTFVVKQIAGVLARRIVCRVQPGSVLEKGQRYGLIRFGSRTDLILPPEATVQVGVGDIVKGGETVLAILKEPHSL